MAYFQQIDELLKPKGSSVLAPESADGTPTSQQIAAPTPGSFSTTISPGAKSSGGANFNAAEQGKTPQEYTQVGYNPKAYAEQNKEAGGQFNLSDQAVKGAQQATEQLKQKSEEFAKSQPQVPNYSEDEYSKAINEGGASYDKLNSILNPTPLTPEQKEPDFSSLKAPEILSTADALATRLKQASQGGNYTRGMSNFDASLYKKSDKYKEDLNKAQEAVGGFNQALDAEIAKWKGTDRGKELEDARANLATRLGNEAASVKGGVENRLGEQQSLLDAMPKEQRTALDEQFNNLTGGAEKKLKDRAKYLMDLAKENPAKAVTNPDFRDEMAAVAKSLSDLNDYKKEYAQHSDRFIDMGSEAPTLQAGNVATEAEKNKFAKINALLGKGDASLGAAAELPPPTAASLHEKEINQKLAAFLGGIGTNKYDFDPEEYGDKTQFQKGEQAFGREFGNAAMAGNYLSNPFRTLDPREAKNLVNREIQANIDRREEVKDLGKVTKKEVGKKTATAKKSVGKEVSKVKSGVSSAKKKLHI